MKITAVSILYLYICIMASGQIRILPPEGSRITARGYDSHSCIVWHEVPSALNYAVYSSDMDTLLGRTTRNHFLHFPSDSITRGRTYAYRVEAYDADGVRLWDSQIVQAEIAPASDSALLDMVQEYTLRYFWDFSHPATGMAYERSDGAPSEHRVTIGGSGMGVMAVLAGVHRNWISREEAYLHISKMVSFLSRVPRFRGMWAHWYDAQSGRVLAFSPKDDGGDVVESALMMQGLLCARAYFDREDESPLREAITTLWEEMEWDFYTQGQNVIYWHYSPQHGFEMNMPIRGYNEALIVYLLAAASPTHPIRPAVYHEGWASWDQREYSNYTEYYGMMLPLGNERWLGGPLFFAHYSYLGLCPRGLRDRYAHYWEQNLRQSLINRAYCIDNPHHWAEYGEHLWGITACDALPDGYMAHMPGYWFDTGTIAPTGAISSMPYTPQYSMDVLKFLYRRHGKDCFGAYGFYDAVNFSLAPNHVRRNYLAIDQGPMMVMIENYRSGLLWDLFMSDGDVRRGLAALDFKIDDRPISPLTEPSVNDKKTKKTKR